MKVLTTFLLPSFLRSFFVVFFYFVTLLLYDILNHLNMIHYGDTYTHFIYGRTVNDHHPSNKAEINNTTKTLFNIFTSLQHFLDFFWLFYHNSSGIIIGICVVEWLEKFLIQKLVFKCFVELFICWKVLQTILMAWFLSVPFTQMSTMFPSLNSLLPSDLWTFFPQIF